MFSVVYRHLSKKVIINNVNVFEPRCTAVHDSVNTSNINYRNFSTHISLPRFEVGKTNSKIQSFFNDLNFA